MKRLARKIVLDAIPGVVDALLPAALDRVLARHVETAIRAKLRSSPDEPLTQVGFRWALIVAFEDAWPGIGRKSAAAFADDCMVVEHGTHGYDWSGRAASELVRQYVADHGEAPEHPHD